MAYVNTLALAFLLAAGPVMAENIFTPTADGFTGWVSASGPDGAPILAGGTAKIEGEDLIPGQTVTLMRGTTVLTPEPLVIGADGTFTFDVAVPREAVTGLHPVVLIAENPAAATVVDVKVSPVIPVSGAEKFVIESAPAMASPYQVAYSPASGAIFVTGAVGRPPVKQSELVKLDADTLEKQASITPAAAPDGEGLFAVYGVAADDPNGNLWVTNTRQGTVSVYKQDDLSLVRQFDPDEEGHPRDVVIHEGRAYVSHSLTGDLWVFDTATLDRLDPITIKSEHWGEDFGAMSMDLQDGKIVTVSLNTPEAAIIDLATGNVRVIEAKGAKSASGAAYDPQEGLIFVGSQETDNLLILSEETGEVLHDVEVGADVLSVAFDPVSRLAFTANRGSGTITVVDTNGAIVANLDVGGMPNQLRADGRGNIYAVNKATGGSEGDRVWRIRAAD